MRPTRARGHPLTLLRQGPGTMRVAFRIARGIRPQDGGITRDLEWKDLFHTYSLPPPPALKSFYGPLYLNW
jgi:hypothetical protein